MTVVAEVAPLWVTARASGAAALVCASGSMAAGLLMALKPSVLRRHRVEVRAAHEALALATFALIVVHGLTLLLDPVLRPGLAGVLVPFASGFERVGTGLGQIAAYGMLALGLTFYARRRLGTQRWRRAHGAIPVFWALAVGHALLTGTDTGARWFLAAILLPALACGALLAQRYGSERAAPA
jgi:methionine sulfoxide reductase heme-binding subunit